ncbi:hypothetical protein HZU77_015760 [Neisseriaceae bacterium TC5R-5]|nr:hypothetical protein [Neisseriaceae bacterium TC5R-5]
MSLYNNIADKLASQAGSGFSMDSLLGGFIGDAATQLSRAVGGGALAAKAINLGAGIATQAATGLVNQHLSLRTQHQLGQGLGVLNDLLRGDWDSAGGRLLDSRVLSQLFPGMLGSLATQAAYWGQPTPLFGGISPAEAKRRYEAMLGESLCRQNLYLLEISSPLSAASEAHRFNLFTTSIDYSPFQLAAEKHKVGGAVLDSVQGCEAVELSLTTMDDQAGSLKRWFAAHHGAAVARNGTVGVPADYAMTIKIVHGSVTPESRYGGGYEDIGLFRPNTLEMRLSRQEDTVQELQMTFSQLDTFMRA